MGELHDFERAPNGVEGTHVPAGSFLPSQSTSSGALWMPPERSMSRFTSTLQRCLPLRQLGRRVGVLSLLFLLLFSALIASWPIVQPSTAFALAFSNPDPALSTPSWLSQSNQPRKQPNLNKSAPSPNNSIPSQTPPYQWLVSMRPAKVALTNAAQHFVSSDGQLLVDIPANSLDATQLTQQHGTISLVITQVKPGAGGGASGQISFGTYEFQFFDATGKALNGVHLLHPLTIHFHLRQDQQMLVPQGQEVYALWNAVQGATTLPAIPAVTAQTPTTSLAVEPRNLSTQPATLLKAKGSQNGTDWAIQSNFATSNSTSKTATVQTPSSIGAPAVQASTVAFGTTAPQATWGMPADFQVGLNSGGLNYSYPLSIPLGPGSFQPSLALNYSSGSVNENHGWQSAAPWVGQGWSLGLGSITWSQENVTPNGSPTMENVWHINDPSGISGQLIPPDQTFSTIGQGSSGAINPNGSQLLNTSNVYIWHTAPESHAKVREMAADANGYPCWRVYLPNGVVEEFGCTSDSRSSYVGSNGQWSAYSWKLDLMIDRYGNQVHITYQKVIVSGSNAERDSAIQDITYDDPACHDTSTTCSSWSPLVDIHFDASQSVANLLNGGCGSGSSTARCDDPVDVSNGLPAPKIMSAYVLNDVQIKVQDNLLHEYVFSYNQGGPTTKTDPNTGEGESVAGYLTLGKIQEEGTNGTSLNAPVVTIQYGLGTQHYSDLFTYSANNGTVCSPYSAAPRDGSASGPCFLWSQSFNQYYITNLDNGRGWNESITWQEAHSNTWGTDNGTNYNNAFQCSSSQTSTNICGTADDKNWSRLVVKSRTATSNGVSSTWSYNYFLATVNAAIPGRAVAARYPCHGACESYDWGNQNDGDYADYWNGDFQSFQQVQVTLPDGSSQTDTYGSTNGWGLFDSSITCISSPCTTAPFNVSNGPVLAGKQEEEQDYSSSGALMKQVNWTWSTNCPPQGVPGSLHASGGSIDPGGSFLFSELDHNNPILDCDPRATQMDTYTTDGVTSNINDARVVHTTTAYTFDGNTCGSQNYDYGNLSKQDVTANDVSGVHTVAFSLFCPNDNIASGTYLTNLPAQTQTLNESGTAYGCTQTYYGGSTNALSAPSQPDVTRTDAFTGYSGGCVGSVLTTLHSYDASGTALTGTDPDNHLGCTNNSQQYTACATYDSFDTHLLTSANAENQTTTYTYTQGSAAAGFGEWLMSKTDPNGQTTTYQYDALGRLTAIINPGDSASNPTVTYTYNNTCSVGQTTPCLEIDTATRFTAGGPLSTMHQWYDGWGNLVETQVPGPNLISNNPSVIVTYSIYNAMNQQTTKSLAYAVAAPSSLSYITPDQTQARTVTNYDSLGRSLGSVTYSNASTIVQSSSTSYMIAQGVPTISSENNNAYEQAITLDAYNHQSIVYTDGFGHTRYSQVFSGTTSPYSVVRTIGTTYDTVGNTLSVTTYDNTGTAQAVYNATYDGAKRLTGYNDSDAGSCLDVPMPSDCSGTTDTAWKYTYDANGNQISQIDPRNQSTYTSYDALNRQLCRALVAADLTSCNGTTYETFFYDSYNNAGTPGATFPAGCAAPSGSYASDPIGHETAELFVGTGGAGNGWRCYGYDARGRTDQSTLSVVTPDAGTITQTVNMTYDDQNDVTSLVYPDGEVLTSNYDGDGRFQSAYFGTASSPDPVQFLVGQTSYANDGQLASLAMGGSGPKNSTPTALFTQNQSYDGIQRPVSTSATEGSTTLFSQTRTYDNVGNVLGLSTSTLAQSGGTVSENEAFCYDALSRLVWAGNSGTPTGGDHCMSQPSNNGAGTYSQAYGYDSLDRLTSSSAGNYTYGDANHPHGVTNLSSVPNQFASYGARGNLICRNLDPTTAHTCAGSTPTGAALVYDNEGRVSGWFAPSGTNASETYLYDNSDNQVLTTSSQNGTPTDTIYFDGYTETSISGGTTTTTKYYSVNGQRLAEKVNGTLSYLVTDLLSNVVMAVNASGTAVAVNLYEPYGQMNYSWGTMPTAHNYTDQRLDSQSGLLYYNFRWYDPVVGQFVRPDTKQSNAQGMNPFAYVSDNPETKNDPTGHWGWGTILAVAVVAVVVAVVVIVAAPVVVAAAAAVASSTAVFSLAVTAGAVAEAVPTALTVAAAVTTGISMISAATGGGTAGGGCGLSFRSDTPVATTTGEQAIGTLHVGENVWSYNPQTKKKELEPIQKVWLNHDNDLVDVTLVATVKDAHGKTSEQKEVIHTNEKHPFLTKEKGFIPVSQIKPGMHVRQADGSYGVVAKLVVVPGAMWMYNLTVAQDHTYTVGLEQWIVHNCPNGDGGSAGQPNKSLTQRFVQNNRTILNGITDPDAPGGDTSKWTLQSITRSRTDNSGTGPYTDRYYLTFNDGSGGQVKISGNYDPDTGKWDPYTFHYSSDQPTPTRWSSKGQLPPDEEEPPPEDTDFFMNLFGVEE